MEEWPAGESVPPRAGPRHRSPRRGLGRPDEGAVYIMSKRGGNGLRAVVDRKGPFWKWSAPSEVDNGNGLRP